MPLKNVTVTLDDDVALWARIRAAEQNTSVSKLLGDILRQRMEAADAYELARRAFFSAKPVPLGRPGQKVQARGKSA